MDPFPSHGYWPQWSIPDAPDSIHLEIKLTVQDGLFKPYARKFILLAAKDKTCKFPLGENELRTVFLQNMRNKKLRHHLMLTPGSIRDLSTEGQDVIAKGLIPDFRENVKEIHVFGNPTGRNMGPKLYAGVQKNRKNGQERNAQISTFPNNTPVLNDRLYNRKLTAQQLNMLGLSFGEDKEDASKI